MLREMVNRVRRWAKGAPDPRVHIGDHIDAAEGLVVAVSFGAGSGGVGADACLTRARGLDHVREVARFCAARSLPVDVWCIRGLWLVPARVDRVARWVERLAADAAPAHVWIDTEQMPSRYHRHLRGHLLRLGCVSRLSSGDRAL
jgi:hypothetical protein